MSYCERNFKTKKALKEAVADFNAGRGPAVYAFNPGIGGPIMPNSTVFLEGPHYPKPHTWYAQGQTGPNGEIVKVK